MLHYLEYGSGNRPVLILHGFLGSGRNLATLAQRWAAADSSLHLYVPDHLGHGRSPSLPIPPTLDSLAAAVGEFCSRLALRLPLTMVGHSLGGRVALDSWRLSPDIVEQVVLLDIPPGKTARMADNGQNVFSILLAAPASAGSRQQMREFLLARGLSSPLADWLLTNLELDPAQQGTAPSYRWRFDRQALAALDADGATFDLWPTALAHAKQLACIRGGDSPFVSDDDVARLQAAGARVVTLPGAGHFLHVDQTDALLGALADLI